MAIERTFQNISDENLKDADQQAFLVSLGWSGADGWERLLLSKRILIISEAGSGKTYECRSQCERLWEEGKPAFFFELASLATREVGSLLDYDETSRFESWLTSRNEIATFFLDSIDELKISLGLLDQALKSLKRGLKGELRCVQIVITTRPIPFDELLVRRLLPVSQTSETSGDGETFARIAMGKKLDKTEEQKLDIPDWRTVALMPLSDVQIADFARVQGVDNPDNLLEDLIRRNAQEFARRPQDLIELCADWRVFKKIRTHREQVESNVNIKLMPRKDRSEVAELSVEKAIDGASRLALAMLMTRRLTIRHSAEVDLGVEGSALDPAKILKDWSSAEHKALLERPLFGFASYGRVRFHHRSVAEYLAAERLRVLQSQGMSLGGLKRLLFASTRGRIIVRPSMRAIAGWLAYSQTSIFEGLRDNEPAVLLTEGDPESLSLSQRKQALRAFVERHSKGSWRGLNVPQIQIHRFASQELASEINSLWASKIENYEIRQIILNLIALGKIEECSEIAYSSACDPELSNAERYIATKALVALDDHRLDEIICGFVDKVDEWPDRFVKSAISLLFPTHLSAIQLCKVLRTLKQDTRDFGDLNWHLPQMLSEIDLDNQSFEVLRDGLHKLLSDGLRWQEAWPHIISDRPHLSGALASVCSRFIEGSNDLKWLSASLLAVRIHNRGGDNIEIFSKLRIALGHLPGDLNEQVFWEEDRLVRSLHVIDDPWQRLAQIIHHGAISINATRDLGWIEQGIADVNRCPADRAMLMEAGMRLAQSKGHIVRLKAMISDLPDLVSIITSRQKPSKYDAKFKRIERKEAKQREVREAKEKNNFESWVKFWREVADDPEIVFSPERSGATAWDLWRAMSKDKGVDRTSGWNRRFLEVQFGKEIADRLRQTLMNRWRIDIPTLESERPVGEKHTTFVRWQAGLAGIYAEAEDDQWAVGLSEEDASVAARYVPLEYSGFPSWLEDLAKAQPNAIETTLGRELSLQLRSPDDAEWPSILLQNIAHASKPVIRIFSPILCEWLEERVEIADFSSCVARNRHLEQVLNILRVHGEPETLIILKSIAQGRIQEDSSADVLWIRLLMRLDFEGGVDALEARLSLIQPSQHSEAVSFFASLSEYSGEGMDLFESEINPNALLRLLRMCFLHVQPAHDVGFHNSDEPHDRTDAERNRGIIVDALLKAKGENGWKAKLAMASDPLCHYFKDRILAVSEENWAQELDSTALNDAQAYTLDKMGEVSPYSNESVFALMVDRLSDLNEVLLSDLSPREAWAGISKEKLIRREIARELSVHSRGLYQVDQEAVTGDEKETDIRLRSATSAYQAVIEVKLADKRSAQDLLDTLESQLVTKYMANAFCKSGCLLFTIAKDRRWDHPQNGAKIDLGQLMELLNEEAQRITHQMGQEIRLHVCVLDLRPRLETEKKSNAKNTRSRKKTVE